MPLSESVTESGREETMRLLAEQNEILMALLLMVIEKQYRPEKQSILDDFQMEFDVTRLRDLRERIVPCLSGKPAPSERMESTCLHSESANHRQTNRVQSSRPLLTGLFGVYLSQRSQRDKVLSVLGRNQVDASKSKRTSRR